MNLGILPDGASATNRYCIPVTHKGFSPISVKHHTRFFITPSEKSCTHLNYNNLRVHSLKAVCVQIDEGPVQNKVLGSPLTYLLTLLAQFIFKTLISQQNSAVFNTLTGH